MCEQFIGSTYYVLLLQNPSPSNKLSLFEVCSDFTL